MTDYKSPFGRPAAAAPATSTTATAPAGTPAAAATPKPISGTLGNTTGVPLGANTDRQAHRPAPVTASIGSTAGAGTPPTARPAPVTAGIMASRAAAQPTTAGQPARPLPVTASPAGSVNAGQASISADMFKRFAELIYKISGIRFAENKAYFLASKIKARMDVLGMRTVEEYFSFLQTPAASQNEHPLLVDEITINETFFFRNQPQLEAFERDILKPLLQKRRGQGVNRLRFWSCASSTGDEAYTLALQLLDMPEAKGFQFDIVGTDISRTAIKMAQEAVYRKYAIRNIPADMLKRYFSEDAAAGTWTLKDEVRRMIRFYEGNLMDEAKIRTLGKFDVAFCRNVLIYFDETSKEKVLQNIANALNEDGLLLAGHSENLYPQRHIFKQQPELGQAMAYQKTPPGTQKSAV